MGKRHVINSWDDINHLEHLQEEPIPAQTRTENQMPMDQNEQHTDEQIYA